jgi:hypothetical protein
VKFCLFGAQKLISGQEDMKISKNTFLLWFYNSFSNPNSVFLTVSHLERFIRNLRRFN